MVKKKYHIFLFLSLFCFTAAFFLFSSKDNQDTKDYLSELFFEEIQSNLDKVSEDLKNEVMRASEHLMAGDSKEFTSNRAIYFVSNGQIVHWTDYHIPYNERFSTGSDNWQIIKTTQGIFLVFKQDYISYNSVNQIIGVVDFYRDFQLSSNYLSTGYNQEIFDNFEIVRKNILEDEGEFLMVDGKPLWKIEVEINSKQLNWAKILWTFLLISSILFASIYLFLWAKFFNKRHQFLVGISIVAFFMFGVRSAMLYYNFPNDFFDIKLFDPKIYAASTINASFGDLLLNIACFMVIVIYAFIWLARYKVYYQMMRLAGKKRDLISFFFTSISFLVGIWFFKLLESIYLNSQVNFDITESLHFDEPELTYIIIFCCLIIVFFLVNHFVLKALLLIQRRNKRGVLIHIGIQFIIFVCIELIYQKQVPWCSILIAFYLTACVIFELFQEIRNFQYKTYLYIVFTGLICSFLTAITIVRVSVTKDYERKVRFADHLILHNDIQGEVMMSEIAKQIINDESILKNMQNGFVKKEVIADIVKDKYLSNYFDKYEIHFSYYNKKGKPYYNNELLGTLEQVKSSFQKDSYKTWVPNLFFITNFKKDFFSIYYHYIDLFSEDKYIGTIVIDYTLKKYIAKSILPSLLQLSAVEGYRNIDKYNYAIFEKNVLQYSVGEFNYNETAFKNIIQDKQNHVKDLVFGKYHHHIDFGAGDKTIIVSSKPDWYYKTLTNFSFHFLLLVLITLLFLISTAMVHFARKRSSDFSTKIQTYLNIATFAPMIFLSVLILGLMASSYRKDQEIQFKNNAELLSSHVLGYLEEYEDDKIGMFELKNSIDKLSKYSGTDINIYDVYGKLVISNQPLLYEAGVISNLINPSAYREIFDMKHRMIELEENIGDFKYNTVYVALATPENSRFMGVMSIPFFNSTHQMEQKKISALSIIINVFAIAFVFLLVGSFFMTKSLTSPLRLIANKLRKVETGSKNEPLYWDANDELGLLISEYNLMLEKIEESKKTFAKTEKELAWKEMAQQVAHEIKNPLTPMKLKLQHLKRVIGVNDSRTDQAIDSLLEQVETLSEIASSFSSFAKMPIPSNERFNLSEVCNQIVSLYENNGEYDIVVDVEDEIYVVGDDKLIGRIITNILLNGVQSVPSDRKALIKIGLTHNGKFSLLSIKDNGTGIPDDIQLKVFVPNFTTKYSGSGIGLAVAKNGIEQMGGKIWFDTKMEKGTTFYIELNLA